jgi:phenylalanyl-tRNA synthetase beta chain
MKLSLAWLSEWVRLPADEAAFAHGLTMAGFEVEGRSAAAPPFSQVVVAHILSAEKHPQADKLRVCQVDDGSGTPLQIVCGAPNARAGIKVPLARVGAVLPGDLKIKAAKLRGIESTGMLCSARELGLGDSHSGLLELPESAVIGADVRDTLLLNDTILEINFTPNRGDALSVLGLAREAAVLASGAVCVPTTAPIAAVVDDRFPVRIEAGEGCARFAGRVIRGVNPSAQTPLWMQERLRRAGQRSLGPLVDVTNYVMLELGQPMHAYDLRRLEGGIQVRWARAGEVLELLEGTTIPLATDMLVIADDVAPVGLAGVMGGKKSGIADDTTDVFLEAAWFQPNAVAGRGRRFGIITDASQRFERGVDPEGIVRAMNRATQLLLDMAGGQPGPLEITEAVEHLPVRAPIVLRARQIERLVGIPVPQATVVQILTGLGMQVSETAEGHLVTAPSWRFDIQQEADLIEEVARVFGYNAIPEIDAPMPQRPASVTEHSIPVVRFALGLVDRGYSEAIHYTFVDPVMQRRLHPEAAALALANPISADLGEMRVSLWTGLVKSLGDNVRRQQERVRLFEHGAKFVLQDNELKEINCIAGIAFGSTDPEQWGAAKRPVDFYDVKADVEALIALNGGRDWRFEAASVSCLHPGKTAQILRGDRVVGLIGEMHPEVTRALDLPAAPILFELELDALMLTQLPRAQSVSRFPAVRRDLAVVVDESLTFNTLRESVTVVLGELLRDLRVFDVYRGKGIENGRKSVALGLILQDKNKTLTDADVDAVMSGVRERLERDVKATFRD